MKKIKHDFTETKRLRRLMEQHGGDYILPAPRPSRSKIMLSEDPLSLDNIEPDISIEKVLLEWANYAEKIRHEYELYRFFVEFVNNED